MPRKSTLKLSRRVVEALAVERGDRVFYDRDLTGFGDVPDLCHIPPILPILQNHTNRRNRTNCQNRRKRTNCQTGTLVGAAQSIPSRPKPGFRKEARL